MKKLVYLLLAMLCIACGSKEEETPVMDVFEVTTAGIGMDCGLVLIDFKEGDSDRIKRLTGSSWTRYYAYRLDRDIFREEGLLLTVEVRRTADAELSPCMALGPAYPWVTVLKTTFSE